ncbi:MULTISPECIES: DUF2855 family protein [Ramlibacter]|uniref:DUF2855 family protein n=1 Tax=Ramlibacter pinisoli TaxID=2682844 RepID=A0A6N8IVX0_9BURK|nr:MULTISPECIES: DUF2855 family protein [Ramlibacter]MBA2965306.1 DUF2855 family protein [Ramlibacter sp. CGMCC 1.13660]MVQ30270.1 DUF2855 family protein [Ramlibacter pinisoli]
MTTTLLVRQDDLRSTRLRAGDDPPLAAGQVRVGLDRLALTANNITYAAFGAAMDYWRFFPAGEDGWGIVPTWGFGTVVQSLHPGVAVGERLYGYWPLAGSAVLQPDRLAPQGWRDAAPHRAALHAVYNQYLRCTADPFYTPASEELQALLRPLYTTSWLIDDFLADNGWFGAQRVLLSSASSKTAYGTAHLLAQRTGIEVVGLTSPAHVAFCTSLGCYGRVLPYTALAELPAGEPCVYVDFAGNAALRRAVHEHFGDALRYSCSVGDTHVTELGGAGGLAGPRPVLFFAPAQAKKRQADWGGAVLQERLLASWQAFLATLSTATPPWLMPQTVRGAAAAQGAFERLRDGAIEPRTGLLVDLR